MRFELPRGRVPKRAASRVLRSFLERSALGCIAVGSAIALPGCPLSDPYYIDSKAAAGGPGTAGASGTGCTAATCAGTCCGDVCADLSSDAEHCNSCANACAAAQSCVASACMLGWSPIAPSRSGFVAREKAAYVTFGNKLFVFGGLAANGAALGDGAVYDAVADTWQSVTTGARMPSPRQLATAVWTGADILVYGGSDASGSAFQDGASYDPALDQWSAISANTSARIAPVAGASATAAVFWGGSKSTSSPMGGAERYDVNLNSWQPVPTAPSDPGILANATTSFSGTDLYVYGGQKTDPMAMATNRAARYNLASNAWMPLPDGPPPRWGAFGVWDSLALFVWGGRDAMNVKSDGQFLYSPSWTAMSNTGAPTARSARARETGWAFALDTGDMVFVGGFDVNDKPLRDGGRYTSFTPAWTLLPSWREEHVGGVAAYVGGSIVVWGGRSNGRVTTTGERWTP
jgi:Galactose oxidase, central domain